MTPSERRVIPYRMNGINFTFYTDTSVFSRKEVDFGTNLLIDTLVKDIKARGPKMERFVDLGCGVGIVGIVIKNKLCHSCTVTVIISRIVTDN